MLKLIFPKTISFFIFASILLILCQNSAAIPVFPGAKGFGTETPAGRGGQIIRVTNLNDSGAGSFRAAIDASGPRIVIFEISGTIIYHGRYKIRNPNITIAGQTAPSPGITLRGSTLTVDTHDVLIQHIRVRTGDDPQGVIPDSRDAINIGLTSPPEDLYNIVIDHCSASWGIDETMTAAGCSNVTYSNCIVSEPLNDSLHSKGKHSKAMVVGQYSSDISLISNLIAHSVDRNPYVSYGDNSVAIVNNLIYNPRDFNINIAIGRGPSKMSIVGNIIKGGPNSGISAEESSPNFPKDPYQGTEVYLVNNRTDIEGQADLEDWSIVRLNSNYTLAQFKSLYKVDSPPVWPVGFVAMPTNGLEDYIINIVGARPADRDSVDQRIINDVIHRSGRIIDSPSDVGGWPTLAVNHVTHTLPSNPNGDDDADGYTNVEEWLHDMAEAVESTITIPENLTIISVD